MVGLAVFRGSCRLERFRRVGFQSRRPSRSRVAERRHSSSCRVVYGRPQGNVFQGWDWLAADSVAGWRVVGTGDFNSDGSPISCGRATPPGASSSGIWAVHKATPLKVGIGFRRLASLVGSRSRARGRRADTIGTSRPGQQRRPGWRHGRHGAPPADAGKIRRDSETAVRAGRLDVAQAGRLTRLCEEGSMATPPR